MPSQKQYLHEAIYNDLFDKINSGIYKEYETIPKEIDLAVQYGVSRPTVRQAIKSLEHEGYLERRKKGGTIVLPKKISQEFTSSIQSFYSEMEKNCKNPKTVVLSFHKVEEIPEKIEHVLAPKVHDSIYKLTRLRYADEEPNVCVTNYLKLNSSIPFLEQDFSKVSLYNTLSSLELPIVEITRTLEVVKADVGMSTLLGIEVNEPLFKFKTIGYSHNHNPIEFATSYYRGDTNSFVIRLNT